jgi:fructokinase
LLLTGTVAVTLSNTGVPQFTIHGDVACDPILATPPAMDLVRGANAVCFGSLAQRNKASRQAIHTLLQAAPARSLRIFDVNLRQDFYSREVIEQSLSLADALKLNDDELPVLASLFGLGNAVRDQMQRRRPALSAPALAP